MFSDSESNPLPWEYPEITNQKWHPEIPIVCTYCAQMIELGNGGWKVPDDAPKHARVDIRFYKTNPDYEQASIVIRCTKCEAAEPVEGDDLGDIIKVLTNTSNWGEAIIQIAKWKEIHERNQRMGL